jgi:serine/threonine-protein kinase
MPEPVIEERARTRVGTTLNGKYRIHRLLGVGGMAAVYAATHRNNKRVAVKVLHAELSIHPGLRSRFMREGYVANAVDHPGAVAVLDDDVAEDGSAFLVMELLDGETLAEACDRLGGKLPIRAVLAVAYQVLEVLAAADAKRVVHRDIKPSNLFLTRSGHVKVLDFGVARVRSSSADSTTLSGLALGTPAFMAPEQALGRSEEIDGLTDLWALGATMFALLSGGPVHAASTPQEQMVLAATRGAPPLASVDREVPPAAAEIVDRALSFERSARWPSAQAMRDAVRDSYRALYAEDPSPAALVFMASPETMPVSSDASLPRSPMASTVPTTPVSARVERIGGPSPTSLVPMASQPHPPATGRARLVVGAAALTIGGVLVGAWGATRAGGITASSATSSATSSAASSATSSATSAAATAEQGEPSPAPVTPPSPIPPLESALASATATSTVSARHAQLAASGHVRPAKPTMAAVSAIASTAPSASSAPVDRFDHQ